MEFYSNPNNFVINDCFHQFSNKMVFFSVGRDIKFRPVLYMYPGRLQTHEMGDLENFLNVYLSIIQKYVFRPYYIENWVMIIDVEKKGLVNFPWKAIKSTVDATNLNFSSRLHKMFILNPSFIFNTTWNMVKGVIDGETAKKIAFIKKKDFGLLQEAIPKDQLLKEYGGDMDLPKSAYPIPNTLQDNAVPVLTEEETKINNIIIENSYKELTTHRKHIVKNHRIKDLQHDAEKFSLETRSLRAFPNESDMSKEMSHILAYSFNKESFN